MSTGDDDAATDVQIVAGFRDGQPVYEYVPAIPLGANRFRLTGSPGFALGIANGDEIETDAAERLGYRVLRRGGNVGIQVFLWRYSPAQRAQLTDRIKQLGGWLDGGHGDGSAPSLLVFTVPATAGFTAIEAVMSDASAQLPIDQWLYANVYDPLDGVTPLNWWED